MVLRGVIYGLVAAPLGVSLFVAACSFSDLDDLKKKPDGSAGAGGNTGGAAGDGGASGSGGIAGDDAGTCAPDHADCNLNPADGCETNWKTSVTSCGGCGSICVFPHATAACNDGKCALSSCEQGFADCDLDPTNGCETNVQADPKNCGECAKSCTAGVGLSAVCNAGTCGVSNCAATTGDCDGDQSNGCEVAFDSDPNDCGFCGNACSFANAAASCAGGTCTLGACNSGFSSCDSNPANGCEAQLASDATNCGACGHDCLGGGCANGKCQMVTLASSLGDPTGIAVDASNVYVTSEQNGTVWRIPKAGGSPVAIASAQSFPFGIGVNSTHVYFTNRVDVNGKVSRVPIGGGTVETVVTGQERPANLALDGTHVYWTNAIAAELMRAPLGANQMAQIVASNVSGILGLVIDSSAAYYSTDSTIDGRVGSVPLAGGTATPFVTLLKDPKTLAQAGSNLFFPTYTDGKIWRLAKSGGNPAELAADAVTPQAITADASYVYYADYTNPGSIRRVAVSGGTSEVIATGQGRPRRLTNDATAVYWTNDQSGTVGKIAK